MLSCRTFLRVNFKLLTIQSVLGLVDLFICFSNSVVDFLSDCVLKFIETLFCILEFTSVIVSHCIDLCLKLVFQNA